MSTLYIKVLSDYYHHIVGDLKEDRKKFLEDFYSYILEKDEYGYEPFLGEELLRINYLIKQISIGAEGMSLEEFFKLISWYKDDSWSNGEIFEYFLYHKKGKEIKIIFDIHSISENEIIFLQELDSFLNSKGKVLKFFNAHNGKYQSLKEILCFL